jgi:hypothetical protein
VNEWVVTFDCGHECDAPAAWEERRDNSKREADRKYWDDQTVPRTIFSVSPCPGCKGKQIRNVVSLTA